MSVKGSPQISGVSFIHIAKNEWAIIMIMHGSAQKVPVVLKSQSKTIGAEMQYHIAKKAIRTSVDHAKNPRRSLNIS